MADDPNVISLDERRRGTVRKAQDRAGGRSGGPAAGGAEPTRRPPAGPAADGDRTPVKGTLHWLYCPSCRTLEYTELGLAGGRVHNVCGSRVHEAALELDLRAETTIARINLERLTILEGLLDAQRKRFEEYLHRLNLAAGRELAPYPAADDASAGLPVADVDAFGLLVSQFFHDPAKHFPELVAERAAPERGDAPTAAGGADAPPPAEE